MSNISKVVAREVLDSRGNPTVEVDVKLSDGSLGRAAVPSGASTGKHEAVELRDENPTRYRGMGVLRAVNNVHEHIAPELIGLSATDQRAVDKTLIDLDGTPDKGNLGANAILAVSLAVARAASLSKGEPFYKYLGSLYGTNPPSLPVPMFNIINGGRHAANSTDFQEFMVVPIGFDSFSRALRAGVEIYHALEDILRARRASTNLGDEGGFAPPLESNQAALELVMEGIERAGYVPGDQCYIAMDVAASEFMLEDGRYSLIREGAILTPKQLIERYERWISEYPIISIEDGLAEEDWDNWGDMTNRIGSRIQLVGDDIYSTNTTLIKKGIDLNVSNTVLIKFNQIGTVSETFDAIHACSKVGWNTIISHRSGETIDDTIADLAVGTSAGQIKAGAPARGERICKYNRLLRIEEELGDKASFAGRNIYERFLSHR